MRNVFFGILNNEKLKTCKVCGKVLRYNHRGIFCSKKCINSDSEVIAKATKHREETCLKKYGVKCNLSLESNKAKQKATNLKRYGFEYAQQNNEVKNKQKQTLLDKYGVDNIWKLPQIQEKCRETQIKNGGIGFQREEIKKNFTQKLIEKYGVDSPFKLPEIKEKINRLKFNKTFKSFERFNDKVIPLFSIEEFDGCGYYDKKYKWKCVRCGNEFEDTCFSHIPRCLNCEPLINGFSYSELELLEFVQQFFPNAKKNRKLIAPKEIDILIEELNLGIEFNGSFYHNIERLESNYHLNKTLQCNELGYRLIHVWEDEWLNNKDIIKSKLLDIFTNKEVLQFNQELDFSWFNGFNYKFKLIEPQIVNRQNNLVENCGKVIYYQ